MHGDYSQFQGTIRSEEPTKNKGNVYLHTICLVALHVRSLGSHVLQAWFGGRNLVESSNDSIAII